MKTLIKQVSNKNAKTLFMLEDSDIVVETMLEDVANVLNSGETPNLMQNEDLEEIYAELRIQLRDK